LSLCEDFVMDRFASAGGSLGWLLFVTIALCELAFAGLCVVATQRAALRQNAEARRYSPIAIGLALLFVYVQFVLTAAWIGWDGLAEVGFRTSNQTTFFEDIELHVEPLPGPITNRAL
jgi:hypothetical protein